MTDKNIWTKLNFTASKEESAYDLLLTQSDQLVVATTGELKMDVEAVDSYLDVEPPKPIALYILYVVAPNLGNFRRKILTVVEGKEEGRFPVDIYCHIDDKKDENINKSEFLDKISEILNRKLVSNSIENLFQQSKEYSKNKPHE
jgi:hypothetical protein